MALRLAISASVLLLELLCPLCTWSYEVLLVAGRAIAPYQEAAAGVTAALGAKTTAGKALSSYTLITLMPEAGALGVEQVQKSIVENQPQVIVTIGPEALQVTSPVAACPIVYLLVAAPELEKRRGFITGIEMLGSPGEMLSCIAATFPHLKNITLLYDPRQNEKYASRARGALPGLAVQTVPVNSALELPKIMIQLRGRSAGLWLIPDLTVISPASLEAFSHFSIDNRIPLITFAKRYLQYGATAAVSAEPYAMGEQAGELVDEILRDEHATAAAYPPRAATKLQVTLNQKIYHIIIPKK